jgi:thiol-disulfide isomerase/thioredoxin
VFEKTKLMQIFGVLATAILISMSGSDIIRVNDTSVAQENHVNELSDEKQLPSIPLKTLAGEDVNLQSFAKNGKITVVSFWATWCSPCKRELDAIANVYPEWQEKYDVELIAVTIDGGRALAKVGPMVTEKGWSFEVLADADLLSQQVLDFQTIPQTFVVDLDGNIVWSHNGYKPGDEKELEEVIAGLLKVK